MRETVQSTSGRFDRKIIPVAHDNFVQPKCFYLPAGRGIFASAIAAL